MRLAVMFLIACSAPTKPGPGAATPVAPPDAATVAKDAPPADPEAPVEPFPTYPTSQPLTNGRVYGTMHISWTTTATTDAPATVVEHYEKLLRVKAETDGKTWTFRRERDDGSTYVGHVLEIIPAGIAANYPGKEVPPKPGDRTVMLSSIGMGPSRTRP